MKIELPDEFINSLVEVGISKRVSEYQSKFNKELLKVQTQLTEALSIVNDLLNNQIISTKKDKLTTEFFIKLWNEGKKSSEIAKETGYNSGYISQMKRKLISQGKIVERRK